MSYYFECRSCLAVTPLTISDIEEHFNVSRPHVACEHCFEPGCVVCMPDGECASCQADEDDYYDEDDDPDEFGPLDDYEY